MSISKAEQETIVRWDRESDTLTVYTYSETAIRKLVAAGARKLYESMGGTCLEMPKNWFRWPKPKGKRKGNAEGLARARQNRILAQNASVDTSILEASND